jgi:hypothetical protein
MSKTKNDNVYFVGVFDDLARLVIEREQLIERNVGRRDDYYIKRVVMNTTYDYEWTCQNQVDTLFIR